MADCDVNYVFQLLYQFKFLRKFYPQPYSFSSKQNATYIIDLLIELEPYLISKAIGFNSFSKNGGGEISTSK